MCPSEPLLPNRTVAEGRTGVEDSLARQQIRARSYRRVFDRKVQRWAGGTAVSLCSDGFAMV